MSYSYKRKRRDTLTGGTNDVNPQFMNLTINESAADTFTQIAQQIPIQRLATMGRAQVMEVLKIFISASEISASTVGVTLRQISVALTTKSFAQAVQLNEPTCFGYYQKTVSNAFSAGGSGTIAQEVEPMCIDLTDGAGHGFLVASDNIYLQVSSTATTIPVAAYVKILYRWKDVSVQEYVGIVQSQS